MSRFRPVRFVGILIGTVVILGVGVYGPATLLGPLPAATMTLVTPEAVVSTLSPPVLPVAGASAIVTLGVASPTADDIASTADAETDADAAPPAVEVVTPIAVGGTTEALPMASIAKVITALVVLDAKPVTDGAGPTLTLTTADYQSYLDYTNQFSRSLAVFQGETWTEYEMLQAMLLGSSNNHADSLARWAFGSVDAYTAAANDWLAAHDLTGTRVVDATGLNADSVGTGTDLARISALAATDPVVSAIVADPASALAGRGIDNRTDFMADAGVTGISNSYTDAAGLCLLFTATVVSGDSSFVFAGAMVGEPDQDTLDADMAALLASAQVGVTELPLLASGAAYASFETQWGETASAVVGVPRTQVGWQAVATGAPEVSVDSFATARKGETIGRVRVETGDGSTVSSPLELDVTIRDPGAGWRLLNPVPVIGALIESRG